MRNLRRRSKPSDRRRSRYFRFARPVFRFEARRHRKYEWARPPSLPRLEETKEGRCRWRGGRDVDGLTRAVSPLALQLSALFQIKAQPQFATSFYESYNQY